MRDPRLIARVLPIANAFNRLYLRLRVLGEEHLRGGPTLFVGNHNGGIAGPDLSCTLATLWNALGPETPLYALAHDFAMRQLTPLGRVLGRFGAVRASRDNARRILGAGGHLLVYPGGDLDAYRASSRRDEIVFGRRNGFVNIARETGARCIFAEPQFKPGLVETLREGTDLRAGTLDPLGAALPPGPSHYEAIMRALGESLRGCLSG